MASSRSHCLRHSLNKVGGIASIASMQAASTLLNQHFRLCVQVAQPFDSGKFNFNKALQKEVLFQFEPAAEASFHPLAPVTESPNLVYINVSPIEYGHVLLVPRVLDCLPQVRPRAVCCQTFLASSLVKQRSTVLWRHALDSHLTCVLISRHAEAL